MEEKLPPHNLEAEEAVLGSLLIDGDYITEVVNSLRPDYFYDERAGIIYKAMIAVSQRRESVNMVTVGQELMQQGQLEMVGGSAFLSHLVSITPIAMDVADYAAIVAHLAASRRIIEAAKTISNIGYAAEPDVMASLNMVDDTVRQLRESQNIGIMNMPIVTPRESGDTILDMAISRGEESGTRPMLYGFRDLDRVTSGLYRQETTVVGARTTVGKSQVCQQIALNLSREQGMTGLYVSLEMSKSVLLEREVSQATGIPIYDLHRAAVTLEWEPLLMEYAGIRPEIPLFYLAGQRSSTDAAAAARYAKLHYGLDYLIIDYIQRFKDCRGYTKYASTHQMISAASSLMKDIAMELDIAVIIASQIGRQVESRAEGQRRPRLDDLKESGSLEEDADVVLLLYREELAKPNTSLPGVLEVKAAKIRQLGDQPAVMLQWVADRYRYEDRISQEALWPE